ncbi:MULTISPECIES: helix-hairpin-helix domain-containing protein [Burkholderia]|uniref:helix-hairpin-helix domain-containing protein n=1 Tax=Burkholderia TaxID=32008 RepID=UPI00084F5EC3|nr:MULTISPECIES: helix-hairpin-helix domain-containing protein [Burkholderia]MBJ9591904.1 DNA-binding protein [Burkholderia seminalis]MBN3740834.1 DNA-binding protein [Burkholderia sp. Tr-20355]MCA8302397.1 DNA-binding protein [Burkholderia seminalis]MCA8423308.1 DNA-binding protein [Burkholderia seminalis]MCA8430800.1 DNA-binding protein [Burkholderia seminalis]
MQTTASQTFEENRHIATCLREAAQRLADQGANPYRVAAYRASAETVEALDRDIRTVFESGGIDALGALPEIGTGVAQAIAELLVTGRWRQLDRLCGDAQRASAFEAVPGIGHALALRIHDLLHIDTLEELERAARNGQLETIAGVGPRRAAGIRTALDDVLSRRRRWQGHMQHAGPGTEPPVELLLYIDRQYRHKAAAGMLPTLAHRRLNADGYVPPPVMHMTKGGWHFTALSLHAAMRTPEADRPTDWVSLYFYDAVQREHQRTVFTETYGSLVGKRIVRGREMECRVYYAG